MRSRGIPASAAIAIPNGRNSSSGAEWASLPIVNHSTPSSRARVASSTFRSCRGTVASSSSALPRPRGLGEHAAPVGDEADPPAVHPGLRVREHVQPRLPEGGEVALGLVVLRPQLGVERAEHQVEARERLVVHVDRAVGEQIDLHRAEHAERVALLLEPAVHRVDHAALLRELVGRHAVRDRERLLSGR